MRNAFARTVYELAKTDDRICVVVADISPAGAMEDFRRDFPDRFINVGVAEQSMISLASGLAMRGMRPFCYTIATFALFRAYEFIRCDLAYQRLPVTIVGMGAGVSYSTLGGTHQATEDVAVALACPGMDAVLAPCDPAETAAATRWCAARDSGGPVYMRIGKAGEPDLTSAMDELVPWEFGKHRFLREALRVGDRQAPPVVVSYGPIAAEAFKVAEAIDGDMVLLSTVCPLPTIPSGFWADLQVAPTLVVIEEASGAPLFRELASSFSTTSQNRWSFALPDNFIHYQGTRREVLEHCGLTAEKIIEQIR